MMFATKTSGYMAHGEDTNSAIVQGLALLPPVPAQEGGRGWEEVALGVDWLSAHPCHRERVVEALKEVKERKQTVGNNREAV